MRRPRREVTHFTALVAPQPGNAPNNKTAAASSSRGVDVVAAELYQGVCCTVLSFERVHGSRSTSEINQQTHSTPSS